MKVLTNKLTDAIDKELKTRCRKKKLEENLQLLQADKLPAGVKPFKLNTTIPFMDSAVREMGPIEYKFTAPDTCTHAEVRERFHCWTHKVLHELDLMLATKQLAAQEARDPALEQAQELVKARAALMVAPIEPYQRLQGARSGIVDRLRSSRVHAGVGSTVHEQ